MKAPASAVFGLVALPPAAKPCAERSDQADRAFGDDPAPATTKWAIRPAFAGLVLLALAGSVGLAAAWPHRPIPKVGMASHGP
jgi:hypothetical protein